MIFELKQEGIFIFERIYREEKLTDKEKLFVTYLSHQIKERHKDTFNTEDLGQEELSMLLKLQLNGFVRLEEGCLTLVLKSEGMKVCNACLNEFELNDFHNNKNEPDLKDRMCKTCRNERNKQFRSENEEAYIESRLKTQEKQNIKRRETSMQARLNRLKEKLENFLERDLTITHKDMIALGFSNQFIMNNEEANELITEYMELQEEHREEIALNKQEEEMIREIERVAKEKEEERIAQIREKALLERQRELDNKPKTRVTVDKFGNVVTVKPSEVITQEVNDITTKEGLEREVLRLLAMGKLNQKQIADYLGIPANKVTYIKQKNNK